MKRWNAALLSGLILASGLPGAAYASTPEPPTPTVSAVPSDSAAPEGTQPAATPTPTSTPAETPTATPTPTQSADTKAPTPTQPAQTQPAQTQPTQTQPTQAPTKRPATTVAESCGGELSLGKPVTCESITDKQHHTYTIRTTIPHELLFTQFHAVGESAQAKLDDDCFLGPYASECVIDEPGIHTIDVYLYYGSGEASYGIGLESHDAPSHCTTLDPATFSATGAMREASLARGAAGDCYRFAGTAGMRLDVEVSDSPAGGSETSDVRGWIEDPAGQRLCPIQSRDGTCSLTGDGTHTMFLADQYGGAVDYRFRIVRKDVPIGCAALREAGFGDLADDQVASGNIPSYGFDCYTITASAGRKAVQTSDGGQINWQLSNAEGEVCSEWGGACDLPAAGTYALWLRNTDWFDRGYQVAFVNLAGDAGCAPTTGTEWDRPVVHVTPASPVGGVCQPFTASAGERIVAYVRGGGPYWISDASGARICDGLDQDEDQDQDGCVLPGSGPYRLIVLADRDREVDYQIRRLSAPVGCPVISPGTYGAGAAGGLSDNRCRVLNVPAAGRHLVRVVDDQNYETWSRIYDADGKTICSAGYFCDFPAAGRYTLIVGGAQGLVDYETATVFASPRGSGCVAVGDQGLSSGAVRGSFRTVGETDCLELPATPGATIGVITPLRVPTAARPDWKLINAVGEDLCETHDCALTRPAPYRILLSAPEDSVAGDYAVVVQRSDRMDGCAVLPQGAFGDTIGATTAFSADRFASCYTIPAGQHATQEIIGYAPVSGTGWAELTVTDSTGEVACGGRYQASSQLLRCSFELGKAYTAVLTASASNFQYRISRKDSSPTGARCQTPTNSVLGGPALAGTLHGDDEVQCYRVTAAAADAYWLGLRSTDYAARYWITDASGTNQCPGYVVPCQVSGSTSYQIFVWPAVDGRAVPYRLDTWRLGADGQTPAQCPTVATAANIGTLTGTLSDQQTAACVAVPVVNGNIDFTVAMTDTAGGTETPEPYLFRFPAANAGITSCSYAEGGRGCWVSLPYPQRTGTALFVLAPKTENSDLAFRAEVLCGSEPCPPSYALGSVSPASVPNSATATLSLRGSALSTTDTVTLTRAGAPSIKALVKSASGNTMTVQADVTEAVPGAWNVVAQPDGGNAVTLNGALTVTAAPLRATSTPSVSGVVRVGGAVRASVGGWSPAASSYSYQWTANGAPIAGAVGSAYSIPAWVRGRRLGVTVTARRINRANTSAASAGTIVATGIAPRATVKPKISGTAKTGKTVRVSVGAWSPRADSYRYEWRLNGKVIKGAKSSTLKVKRAWAGKKLTVVVTAKRAGHADGRTTSAAIKAKR